VNFRASAADPGSAVLTPDRDKGSVLNILDHISERLVTRFPLMRIRDIFDPGSGIWDTESVMENFGSGVNILDPQHWFWWNARFVK
jgi:hypothetical protein